MLKALNVDKPENATFVVGHVDEIVGEGEQDKATGDDVICLEVSKSVPDCLLHAKERAYQQGPRR